MSSADGRNAGLDAVDGPPALNPDALGDANNTDVISQALTVVHDFDRQMPTGVTVSRTGRVFVSYPLWDDPINFSVAEIVDGAEVPYPDQATNVPDDREHFLSVQSVVVDGADRLWALDTGSINEAPVSSATWPKLVAIDLTTNKIVQTIHFPANVVLPTSYINDVRFDLRRGAAGMAFISDSSSMGANAIIVVDLATGHSWRKLNDDPSVKGDPTFSATVEGRLFEERRPGQAPMAIHAGIDGIALPGDGSRFFYTPLTSRRLFSVSAAALADEAMPDAEVAATIQSEPRTFASDGLEGDAQDDVFLTDWEHNAIMKRTATGQLTTVVQDERLIWPDSMSISADGYLYVTANQLNRMPRYNEGLDLRVRPYQLFRVKIDGTPARLTPDGGTAGPLNDGGADGDVDGRADGGADVGTDTASGG